MIFQVHTVANAKEGGCNNIFKNNDCKNIKGYCIDLQFTNKQDCQNQIYSSNHVQGGKGLTNGKVKN